MTKISALSRKQHTDKRWQPLSSYSFAAQDMMIPLTAQELQRACTVMPVGFIQSPNEEGYQLVALQGLQPGKNLLFGENGRWIGSYVPAAYRSYPFLLASTEDDRKVLCVRNSSVIDSNPEGEGVRFFNENGSLAKPVQAVLDFLEKVDADGRRTQTLCNLLQAHELIRPWSITIKAGDEERKVEGLFRVDEAAFNALSAEAFQGLRAAGALTMIYCQLLSMQHLRFLAKLANRQLKASRGSLEAEEGDLNLEFLQDDDTVRFH